MQAIIIYNQKWYMMISFIFLILKTHIQGWFLFHLLFSFAINSIFIPFSTKIVNDYVVSGQIQNGIFFLFWFTLIKIATTYHNIHFLEPYKLNFRENAHLEIENLITKKFTSLNWNKIRVLGRENVERTKSKAKYPLLEFLEQLMTQTVDMFPFFGYLIWLTYISPFSVLFYVIAIGGSIVYFPSPMREFDQYYNIWERYDTYIATQFTDIIHSRGEDSHKKMVDCMAELENQCSLDRLEQIRYNEYINIIFNIVFSINLVFFVWPMMDISLVITYLQYSYQVRNNVSNFGYLFRKYSEATKEYEKLESVILSCAERENVPQIYDFAKITITKLNYQYVQKDQTHQPFGINLTTPISFMPSHIYKLDGGSGNGKSTFLDIICAIIPYNEIDHCVYYDDQINEYAFDSIVSYRVYAEQLETVNWKPCVYDIITGEYTPEDSVVIDMDNSQRENLVWQACLMAGCDDFLKQRNECNTLSWIYTKNINPSGGQKGRILIARIIYRILTDKPKLVILDEVDKSIQPELALQIMNRIFEYCRENKLIVLVAAHSTEIKELVYDDVIYFDKGRIGLI